MKKALALVLAVAMIASMAVASFAAITLKPETTVETADKFGALYNGMFTYTASTKSLALYTGNLVPGDTYYILLNDGTTGSGDVLTDDKSASGLNIKADWTEGEEAVASVELVKKEVNTFLGATTNYGKIWMLEVKTNEIDADKVDVEGVIAVKGKSGAGVGMTNAQKKVDAEYDVTFSVGYATPAAANFTATGADVVDDGETYVYDFAKKEAGVKVIADDDAVEYEIAFGDSAVVVTNVKTEKKVLLSLDTDYIEEIEDAYPEASLEYVAMTGNFKRTAEVTLYAEEDTYLYEVVDGALVAVDAEYDEWEEAFIFKTRKLGTYVISDVELDVVADVVVTNPSTGAAA